MDSRGEASVGQLNNHPPFVNPPSIPLLYCSSAGWYTGWDAPWLFLFLSSFFFLFFLYFSLYRQIRATEYEYIIRVTSGTRTMQLGKEGEGGRRDSYRSIQKNYSNFRHALLKFLHQFRDVRFVRTASANMTAIFESWIKFYDRFPATLEATGPTGWFIAAMGLPKIARKWLRKSLKTSRKCWKITLLRFYHSEFLVNL